MPGLKEAKEENVLDLKPVRSGLSAGSSTSGSFYWKQFSDKTAAEKKEDPN